MKPALSIVVPVCNEEQNIAPLAQEISGAMDHSAWTWEAVWVSDHSTDASEGILKNLMERDPRHRFVNLTVGQGQSAALVEGFRIAQADILVTLDGDGQNDPADIPRLVSHLLETKADMVNGRRLKRHDSFIRKVVSALGNLFRNVVTGENLNDVGCALRAFHRRCVSDLSIHHEMNGMHRFLPSVARINGYRRLEQLNVNHRPRSRGTSKYTALNRLPSFLQDSVTIRRRLRTVPPSPRSNGKPPVERRRA